MQPLLGRRIDALYPYLPFEAIFGTPTFVVMEEAAALGTVEVLNGLYGLLLQNKGLIAWIFLVEEEDQIRLRFRSKGPVVNDLARRFGGGGHALAAGASAKDWAEAELAAEALRGLFRS